mmetsp:Transcript_90838/g.256578  ORF Transcript_90838/g.256578 Transcript_90838/m.256578 type:complete len:733 (-) Transcript_90838:135-2333(-)
MAAATGVDAGHSAVATANSFGQASDNEEEKECRVPVTAPAEDVGLQAAGGSAETIGAQEQNVQQDAAEKGTEADCVQDAAQHASDKADEKTEVERLREELEQQRQENMLLRQEMEKMRATPPTSKQHSCGLEDRVDDVASKISPQSGDDANAVAAVDALGAAAVQKLVGRGHSLYLEGNVQWLNMLLGSFWSRTIVAVEKLLLEDLLPQINATIQAYSNKAPTIRLNKFSLGSAPEFFQEIDYKTNGKDKYLEVAFNLENAVDVVLQASMATVGVKHVKARGTISVRILHKEDHKKTKAVLDGVEIFMKNAPTVDLIVSKDGAEDSRFEIKAISDCIHDHLVDFINQTVAEALVLPNRVPIAFIDSRRVFYSSNPAPKYVLRLSPLRAEGLRAAKQWRQKWTLDLKGTYFDSSSPYIELQVGAKTWRSDPVEDTLNPDFPRAEIDFLVWHEDDQHVSLSVKTMVKHSLIFPDSVDILGSARIVVGELISSLKTHQAQYDTACFTKVSPESGDDGSDFDLRIPLHKEKKPDSSQGYVYIRKPQVFELSKMYVLSSSADGPASRSDQAVAVIQVKVCDIVDVPTLRGKNGHLEIHWVEDLARGVGEQTLSGKSGEIEADTGIATCACQRTAVDERSRFQASVKLDSDFFVHDPAGGVIVLQYHSEPREVPGDRGKAPQLLYETKIPLAGSTLLMADDGLEITLGSVAGGSDDRHQSADTVKVHMKVNVLRMVAI